ncbi:DnaJ protein [Plasmodium coatneyi]|uniref:DnaJ protein n=1 Tax=Plasmodium coatneyi TaxID=208452 RepID=A0A1B1DVU9_9APIC|nr:DnaJ protein [Plasmodium coatneyi]ANQ06926.1 DnaJ protein [Plasmodium coatneyi]
MKSMSSYDTGPESSELSSFSLKGKSSSKGKGDKHKNDKNVEKNSSAEYSDEKETKKKDEQKKKKNEQKDKKGIISSSQSKNAKSGKQSNIEKTPMDMFKSKIKFLTDNIIIIGIILSFMTLITFKYLEEKYSLEKYLEEGDSFDYYEVLKCKRGDSINKIKKNYRDLSKMYHPDSNKDCKDCDKKFRDITKAYKTLSDPRLKKAYDHSKGKVLKLIESNSVNLTMRNYKDLVENSNDYWIIQIYSDTDNLSLNFSKIWEEAFDKYHEYISFGRINILTDKKLVKSKVPFNVKIFPTIFILAPDGTYHLYSNIFNATSKDFQSYINNYYPNLIYNVQHFNKAYSSLMKKSDPVSKSGSSHIDKNNKVLLLSNKSKLSLQVKHITFKYRNIYTTYAIRYDEIEHLTNEPLKKEIIDALKVLSVKKSDYIKENENIDYFILVNNKEQVKIIRRISSTNIKNVYKDALMKNLVEINATNVDSVCSTVGSRHTYCYVTIIDSLNNEDTLTSLKKIYQHVNNSYASFTSKLGADESDSSMFIQPVYLLKSNMTKNFLKFAKEKSVNTYDSFFMDYSANTFATINEIKNLSNYSQKKEDLSFLSNIYKDIEILTFEKIPKYCLPMEVNCLYNPKKTFSYRLYNIFKRTSPMQVILSAVVGFFLYPSFKNYGKLRYACLAASMGATLLVTNIKDFLLLLAN